MADGLQISVRDFKAAFFDRRGLDKRVDAWKDRELSRMGAFTRQRMKSLVRYRTKASKPGEPPSAHRKEHFKRTTVNRKTGVATVRATSPLRELIFFAKDEKRGSVVVGPAAFGRTPGIAPLTLERGGPVVTVQPVPRAKGRKASPRQSETFQRLLKEGRIILPPAQFQVVIKANVRIAPRPFVQRAGEAEARIGLRKASR